jgi:hypothetical protein
VRKSASTDERHGFHVVAAPIGLKFQVQAGIHKALEVAGTELNRPPECPLTDERISTARRRDDFVNGH